MSSYITTLYSFCVAVSVSLGLLVFLKDKKAPSNRNFFFITLCIATWMVSLYLGYKIAPDNIVLGNIFIRIVIGAGLLCFYYLARFYYFFPRESIHISRFQWAVFNVISAFVVGISVLTPLVYKTGIVVDGELVSDEFGPLYLLFVFYSLFCISWSLIFLIKKVYLLRDIEKSKAVIASMGLFLFVLLTVSTNIVLPAFDIFVFQKESVFFVLFFLLPTFYAILRYRFLDIKFIITQSLKQVIAFSVAFVSGYVLFKFLSFLLPNVLGVVIQVFIFLAGLNIYLRVIKFFHSDTFHRFFGITPVEHFQKVLHEFKNANTVHKSLQHLQHEIKNVFCEKLHIQSTKLLLCSDKVHNSPSIKEFFKQQNSILVTKEALLSKEYSKQFKTELKSLGEVVVPLFRSSHNPIGILVLGKKRFDDPYSQEEISMLAEIEGFLSLTLTGLLYAKQLQDEVREKTKELHEKNVKLQELDKTKDDFISIASHELRTPLTVIKGYSSFLLDGEFGKLEPQQSESVQDILHNSEELIVLVNKMLDISRLEAGKMEFNIADVSLHTLLKDIVHEFQFICTQKNITLSFHSHKDMPETIKTDSIKVKRIMMNLLGNSYKFTPNNGNITVNMQPDPNDTEYILVSVKDSGIGIPKEKIPFVFEKFQQVQNLYQKTYSGTGLGLSIVKGILEKLGGKIWIESIEKKGSTFFFTLPKDPHLSEDPEL